MPEADVYAIRATQPAPACEPFLDGFVSYEFRAKVGDQCIERRVLRRPGTGPTVVLIHEIPTVTRKTVRLAELLGAKGFQVVMPVLVGRPAEKPGPRVVFGAVAKLCVSREFAALAVGETGAIVDWLRALIRHEHDPARGAAVGVIGMCFSGGFALATTLDPLVGAAVVSQPGLPFPIWFDRLRDIGLSSGDLDDVRERVGAGSCLRGLRYSSDVKSPVARFDRLKCEFPEMETVQIQTGNPNKHSVLGDALDAPDDSPLCDALNGTLGFLERRLL